MDMPPLASSGRWISGSWPAHIFFPNTLFPQTTISDAVIPRNWNLKKSRANCKLAGNRSIMLLLPLQHWVVLLSGIWSLEIPGYLFKKGQWEPEWTSSSATVKNAEWFSPCLQLQLAQNWHGIICWQMDKVPFLRTLGNDVHVFHDAHKSSSGNRISRDLGTCKTLSLLFSSNCCDNCDSIFSMEI